MPTLDWLNRASAFSTAAGVPYRLLEQVSMHGASSADNLLILGDNLEALKALLPFYRSQIKCIFIHPPYNTQSAFEHYDDNLEHAQWLSMMLPRLQLLRELLREDGSIWVTIDDNEGHYLKVLMDEVFGRGNFVANVVWQSKDTPGNNATGIAETHNHTFCYSRNATAFLPNMLERNEEQLATYKNPDNDERGPWLGTPLTRAEFRERDHYALVNPVGRAVLPPIVPWRWTASRWSGIGCATWCVCPSLHSGCPPPPITSTPTSSLNSSMAGCWCSNTKVPITPATTTPKRSAWLVNAGRKPPGSCSGWPRRRSTAWTWWRRSKPR